MMSSHVLNAAESVSVTHQRQTVQSDPRQGIAITGLRSPRRNRTYRLSWEAARNADAVELLRHHAQYATGVEFDFIYQGSTRRVSYVGPVSVAKRGKRYVMAATLFEEG